MIATILNTNFKKSATQAHGAPYYIHFEVPFHFVEIDSALQEQARALSGGSEIDVFKDNHAGWRILEIETGFAQNIAPLQEFIKNNFPYHGNVYIADRKGAFTKALHTANDTERSMAWHMALEA